jgi:hypothetical protein
VDRGDRIAALGEVLEFVSALGLKKGGGSSAVWWARSWVGCSESSGPLLVFIPILGLFIGVLLGTFVGAWLGELSTSAPP